MDECNGKICALPCCLSWIRGHYGVIGSAPLLEIWNGEGARRIRELIAAGRQKDICAPNCPHRMSGRYNETGLSIMNGPAEFVENQQLNLSEIKQRKSVLHSRPILLKVVPTLRCNLRCSMCFQENYSTPNLGENFWRDIEHLLPYVHEITFQGGEVTLDKGFRSFIESASLRSHRHLRISLITNGTVLDDRLLKGLARVRLNYVIVSLNAATRETYTQITKKDLFNRVVGNIRRLNELADYHPQGDFTVYASFVIMRSNFHELPQFLGFARDLGTEVQLLHVIGDCGGEDIFARTDQHEALHHILDHASNISSGTAKEQIERIRKILESHQRTRVVEGEI